MLGFNPLLFLGRLMLVGAFILSSAAWSAVERLPLPPPQHDVILQVRGALTQHNVGDEAHFDFDLLTALPARQVVTSTSVTDGEQVFEGVLVRDLLDWVGAQGNVVEASALNDYVIEIPADDFREYDVILAHTMNGERLSARDKGPLWIVYPRDEVDELQDIRYDYRWVWQLHKLEVR